MKVLKACARGISNVMVFVADVSGAVFVGTLVCAFFNGNRLGPTLQAFKVATKYAWGFADNVTLEIKHN